MPEFVRVKDPVSGHEFTTSAGNAANLRLEVLKSKPALDPFGRHLPAKPHVGKSPSPKENV